MPEGTLIVNASGIRIKFTNVKGTLVEMAIPEADFCADLKNQKPQELNGRSVEFDEVKGQPNELVGGTFQGALATPPPQLRHKGQPYRPQPRIPQPVTQPPKSPSEFVNPYSFLLAIRGDLTGPLADAPPVGHDRLQAGRHTGVIRVNLTTETPLLIPDAACMTEDNGGHKTFPVRVGADAKPYLAPTSVKGMLRSAYEAVTNSRLGVFSGHEDCLGLRVPAREGPARTLVPARIESSASGLQVLLYPGDSKIVPDRGPDGPMYAAWLPSYGGGRRSIGGRSPSTDKRYGRISNCGGTRIPTLIFGTWSNSSPCPRLVRPIRQSIFVKVGGRENQFPRHQADGLAASFVSPIKISTTSTTSGCFSAPCASSLSLPLPDSVVEQWRMLVTNYQNIHEQEIRQGQAGPPALSRSVWSRHVTGGSPERELAHGTLGYAELDDSKVL